MTTATPATALVAALCLLSGVVAQRGNYLDQGAFEYDEPAPPPRAAPRPAPAYRPTSSLSASPRPTPVPILKQINRHNEDGSYTYGYEGADGAFKIETKLPNGEVMGKYGYVDDSGKVRVVEYGANRYGFQPAGEGITVAPPTLVDETTSKTKAAGVNNEPVEYDEGQYYEEVPIRVAPAPRPAPRPAPPRPAPRPAPRPVSPPQFSQDVASFQSSQNFGPARAAPSSFGPVPPRAAVPGAAPVGPTPSFSQPASRPVARPPPQQSYFAPAPVYESRPAPAPQQPQPSRNSYGRSSGILDQLEKDFALPSNSGPALHDITFSSY